MREFNEQELVRRGKVEEIRKVCNPYPEKYEITHSLKDAALLEDETKNVTKPVIEAIREINDGEVIVTSEK